MEQQYTPLEVLDYTISILENITLPCGMKASDAMEILTPVQAAVSNLQALAEAIKTADGQEEKSDG